MCVPAHGVDLNSSSAYLHLGVRGLLCAVWGVGLVCLVCWAWICWHEPSHDDVEVVVVMAMAAALAAVVVMII